MIAAADFDQRITLQQKVVTQNGIGEEIVTWSDVATTWASVRPLRGREFFTANQMQHAVDARFLIRSRPGLAENMRILWKSEPYDITGLIPGTGPYAGTIEIMAVNGVRDGR